MSLPKISVPSEEVTFSDGSKVEVRGLTRGQALAMQEMAQAGRTEIEVEAFIFQCACGVSETDAKDWIENAPSGDGATLLEVIFRISGLTDDVPKGS